MKKVKNVFKRIGFGLVGILGITLTGGFLYGISWILGKVFKGVSWLFNWISERFPILIEKLQQIRLDFVSVLTGILLVIAFMMISSFTMWIWKKIKNRKASKKQKKKKIRFGLIRRTSDEEKEEDEIVKNLDNAV